MAVRAYDVAEMSDRAAISTKFACTGVISNLEVMVEEFGEASEMSADAATYARLASGPLGRKGHRFSG